VSKVSVIRGFLTDAAVAIDTAEVAFTFGVEVRDQLAMSNALDYLDDAESAIADARERIEALKL
jgi:hypothetical protein